MISRPNKKGSPLPFYMQQVHDRSGIYLFTDKSLQLNKYSEGKYIPASSTFFPKKSFNNIINRFKIINRKANAFVMNWFFWIFNEIIVTKIIFINFSA